MYTSLASAIAAAVEVAIDRLGDHRLTIHVEGGDGWNVTAYPTEINGVPNGSCYPECRVNISGAASDYQEAYYTLLSVEVNEP